MLVYVISGRVVQYSLSFFGEDAERLRASDRPRGNTLSHTVTDAQDANDIMRTERDRPTESGRSLYNAVTGISGSVSGVGR